MRLRAVVPGVLVIVASAAAQTVSVHIESSPGKSQFRVGEAIGLTLSFELNDAPQAPDPNKPGWMVRLFQHDRSVLGFGRDRFVVSPETGTRDPWNYRLHEGIAYSGPPGNPLGDKPLILNQDLNQWVRFERPGHYTVSLHCQVTGPQSRNVEIESNQISVDIIAAEPEWQAAELASDIAALDANQSTTDSQSIEARMSAARRITYLDTPAAVREMARQLGTADIQTPPIFVEGLRSSQYGSAAVAAMKELLRSPSEPVTPMFLRTLAGLDKTVTEPQAGLAEVIDRKQGTAKAVSIKTLLDDMPAERVPSKLRTEIAGLFQDLPISQQSELLDYEWMKIDSPEMVPVLRHIYETASQNQYPVNQLLASAVERLYELDTNRTRTLLLEEMKRRDPRLPYRTLSMLPDATIPELDAILLDNFQHYGGRPVAELIARYSTNSILDPVKEFYMKRDAEMRSRVTENPNIAAPACEPPLVAYFLRVEPAWGEKLLRESLAVRSYTMGRCWLGIVGQTAAYNSGPVWEKVAIDALKDPAVPVKIDAVRSLAQYGSPESKSAILDAFRYWHQWWEIRGEPDDENRRLEQTFAQATTRPKNWTPSDNDLATVRDLCITAGCRSLVPQRVN
jgi:hypothetical protein